MKEKLLDIIEELCEDDIVRNDLDLDLLEEGLIDSLGIVELIVAIEDNFGITLSPSEFDKEDLATVNKILHILEEKGAV